MEKKTLLTDVQFAYMMGRNEHLYLGGISTHFYAEFERNLDPVLVENSVNRVIVRQEMLRAYIAEDGTQRILDEAPRYKVICEDLSGLSDDERERILLDYRNKNSDRVFPLGKWPMFEFHMFKVHEDRYRLIVDFDMMLVDGMSTELLIQELLSNYDNDEEVEKLPISFSDFIVSQSEKREERSEEDMNFWNERINDFQAGPFLNKLDESMPDVPKFNFMEYIISEEDWSKRESYLREKKILPSIYLLTAYAKTVSKWTNLDKITINMTVSDRKGLNLSKVIGDFTKILPVDFDFSDDKDIYEISRETQKKISVYKKHLNCNMMAVAKNVCIKDDVEDKAAFPFVFTGMFFDLAKEGWQEFGERIYQASQTPQVLLDNQITLKSGALTIHWDYPKQYWNRDRLQDVQRYFVETALYGESKVLDECAEESYAKYNDTKEDILYISPVKLIHDQAVNNPDNTAVMTANSELTYEELDEMSSREANYLIKNYGYKKGYLIEGVRDYTTIVHMIAVAKTGGYYVPVATGLPEKRKDYVLKKSNAVETLTADFYRENRCDDMSDSMDDIPENGEDLLYVIYTSGTTGNPKGVEISRKAMMNTVLDMNRRFNINEDDRFIGISSFGFDLSVYDVFGSLTTGAAVFLHDKQENIYGMIEELEEFPISVWNTVPALMQILVNELDKDYVNNNLRLVLLSGDWIPVDLPDKIKKHFPKANVISLGGATEASIWSIYYPIEEVKENWKSIPYGYPLSNQTMYILGYDKKALPENIEGDIYIGGIGVALGYQNDEEKTKASFIDHPIYGRLYATGDRGYLSNEGYMVFCGRKDNQVKIHGNRIELGEIESCLKKQPNITAAVAQVVSGSGNTKKLFGYYVPADSMPYDKEWVEETAAVQKKAMEESERNLPDYLTTDEYKDISDSLEEVSTAIISNTFYKFDFFTNKDEIYTLDNLFLEGKIIERYRKLINQWADVMVKIGKLSKKREGVYQVTEPLKEIDVDSLYDEIMKKKGVSYWGGSFEFLMLCNKNVLDILKADVNPLTILFPEGETDRAENIYRSNPVAEYMNMLTASAIEEYIKNWKKDRPVRILEFGAGTGGTTADILERIKNYNIEYTFTDLSTFFTEKAKEKFAQYDFIKYGIFNIDQLPQAQGYQPECFDIIIGANVLHDSKIINKTLKNFRYMLAKEGMLVALEVTTNKIYHKVSIGFIEGFSGYNDERLKKNEPLLSAGEWKEEMEKCGFILASSYPEESSPAEVFDQHVIYSYSASSKDYKSEEELYKKLEEDLPAYMIPEKIYALYELPLSKNAKVNLKELPYEMGDGQRANAAIIKPETETEKLLSDIICETLGFDEISTDVNIFTVGADSLKSISILTKLKNHGIEVSLTKLYKYATIKQLAEFIDHSESGDEEKVPDEKLELADFKPDLEHRYDPFPLSDLQESYYIGAHETEGFSSIPTAGYVEIECPGYDYDRLINVYKKVIERHDILRTYIDEEGMQHVLKELEDYSIPVTDLRGWNEDDVKDYLENTRREMVATRLDLSIAPLSKCKLSQLKDDFAILHIYADGQIMDGWSFQLFFTELGTFYKNPDTVMEPLKVTFRDYIRYREALKTTKKYEADKKFWMEKIPDLPSAGVLPVMNDIADLDTVEGIQVECGLPIETWNNIEKKAMEHGVSAFSVLMTSFAVAVARWNDKKRFLLNIPEFYRPPFHEDIFKVLGECASFLLFTMDDDPEDTFYEKVVKTQQQIMELKDHNSFSGMEITREIYRKNNGYSEVLAPLVFGMLPDAQEFQDRFIEIQKEGMRIRYQENHTSQIWIDVNTCVYSDRIEFNYNSLKGLIRKEVLEKLAAMQKNILFEAATNEEYWNNKVNIPLPDEDKAVIDRANSTKEDLGSTTLTEMIRDSFEKYKDNIFVKMKGIAYTYDEIHEMVRKAAGGLKKIGVMKGDKVAVYIGKGLEQIVSALATLYIGAVYVPIEYDYSYEVVANTLSYIDQRYVLVNDKDYAELKKHIENVITVSDIINDDISVVDPVNVSGSDTGVIIHTSGTTGRPKAVMLKHESLMNAILYTNRRYNVSFKDTAMAVTNSAHDMSLYDIFGMIAAGASVVMPEEDFAKDPEYWAELMTEYDVTIWNSVPAMQEMLMEVINESNRKSVEKLRLVILGGDYIKSSLLNRIKSWNSTVKLVSAGGPTETTLWNILHDVEESDLAEETIPYGKPIANNRYYILNENMQQVPLGVTGTLYGAGIGVSSGYFADEELTQKRFIKWNKELLYNTGDRGHYREDGTIIFDGREDQQVKVNGKRIELSAISSTAESAEHVEQAAAIVNDRNQIVLFYTGVETLTDEIRAVLESKLPDYMMPKAFIYLDKIPLTINGKVDKKSLASIYEASSKNKDKKVTDNGEMSELEILLREKFCELLNLSGDEIDLDSDFFAMGGNSLIAMKLLSQLRETFDVDISLTDLFMTSTIREMKELLEERNAIIKK
ncbi:non-ribosomal peptide synthetase [Eubacterium ruminantium]|uniref:non-ribosomal peptide synthetase n=1 Tax=Eubacterium ruminantium TaxID=42322 RepID=UPI001569AB88|nr:non-ribosomal peptide synthetase [Eubacterium ruminantium]